MLYYHINTKIEYVSVSKKILSRLLSTCGEIDLGNWLERTGDIRSTTHATYLKSSICFLRSIILFGKRICEKSGGNSKRRYLCSFAHIWIGSFKLVYLSIRMLTILHTSQLKLEQLFGGHISQLLHVIMIFAFSDKFSRTTYILCFGVIYCWLVHSCL